MAGYPSTVYRLEAAGELCKVVVEEPDETLEVRRAQVTMSAGSAGATFDGITIRLGAATEATPRSFSLLVTEPAMS